MHLSLPIFFTRISAMRRQLVLLIVILSLAATFVAQQRNGRPAFNVVEASIPDMQKALKEGRTTSKTFDWPERMGWMRSSKIISWTH